MLSLSLLGVAKVSSVFAHSSAVQQLIPYHRCACVLRQFQFKRDLLSLPPSLAVHPALLMTKRAVVCHYQRSDISW